MLSFWPFSSLKGPGGTAHQVRREAGGWWGQWLHRHLLLHYIAPAWDWAIRVQQTVVHKHEEGPQSIAAGHQTHHDDGVEVWGTRAMVHEPGSGEGHVLSKHSEAVDEHPTASAPFSHTEPAENVHDAHHHVIDDLLPFGHAEVCFALNDPKRHDAPVGHDEDAKVKLEHRGKQGECQGAGSYGEQVPENLNYDSLVGHG